MIPKSPTFSPYEYLGIEEISFVLAVFRHLRDWHTIWLHLCVARKRLCNEKNPKKHSMRSLDVADT